jgi:hypothetical protein
MMQPTKAKFMKAIIAKMWATVTLLALPTIAYAALPLCIAVSAGLLGFGIVAALDVWGDIYFVNGAPVASALIILVSLCGLWLLQPSSEATARLRARFSASYKQAKTAWSSVDRARLSSVLTDAFNKVQQCGRQSRELVTSNFASDHASKVQSPTNNESLPLVHSVVWGKPINRQYEFNCSINSEANGSYAARK